MLRWGGGQGGGHVLYINKITEQLIFHIQGELQYVRHNGGETSALCPLKVIGVCMCVCVSTSWYSSSYEDSFFSFF